MLLDDDTALIGTPGPYTWRGTVFAVSVSDDFLHRDKTLYYGPLTQDHSPVDKYSYLGTVIYFLSLFFSPLWPTLLFLLCLCDLVCHSASELAAGRRNTRAGP